MIDGVAALGALLGAGCLGSEDGGDRPCSTDNDGPGCSTETAADLVEEHVHRESSLEIVVSAESGWFSGNGLSAEHTTTAGSLTDNGESEVVLEDISTVAWWYAAAVNDEFDVDGFDATIVYSMDTPEELATYQIEYDWAENFTTGEWTENEYYAAVYETFDVVD